jgi:hypothetical protein
VWYVAGIPELRNAYTILIGKPEEKGLLGKLNRRWEDNIKLKLQEIRRDCADWIQVTVL